MNFTTSLKSRKQFPRKRGLLMKKILLTLALVVSPLSYADSNGDMLTCHDGYGGSFEFKKLYPDKVTPEVRAIVRTTGGPILFSGKILKFVGGVDGATTITNEFEDSGTGSLLTIIKTLAPGSCGRGSCDNPAPKVILSARIEPLNAEQIFFNCY